MIRTRPAGSSSPTDGYHIPWIGTADLLTWIIGGKRLNKAGGRVFCRDLERSVAFFFDS